MTKGPSVLLIDIETQPDLVWTWGVYQENAIAVKSHWQILSFSAEWVSGKPSWYKWTHLTKGLPDYKDYRPGNHDCFIVDEIHSILNDADIVVAHNGADFDMRKLNARFIYWGMTPPKPYKIVDTRREISRVAGFSSNKLDWLAKQMGLGKKLEHEGWPLWEGCIEGKRKWWKKMKDYNRHDIILLRKLYFLLAPWIRGENLANWKEGLVCPHCGSKDLTSRGTYHSKTRAYHRWQCGDLACGKWCRSTFSEKGHHAQVVALDTNTRP